jgi:hypothetical protein
VYAVPCGSKYVAMLSPPNWRAFFFLKKMGNGRSSGEFVSS